MKILVEWRNAVGCQIDLVQVKDEFEAAKELSRMVGEFGSVEVGDTFHILAGDGE